MKANEVSLCFCRLSCRITSIIFEQLTITLKQKIINKMIVLWQAHQKANTGFLPCVDWY